MKKLALFFALMCILIIGNAQSNITLSFEIKSNADISNTLPDSIKVINYTKNKHITVINMSSLTRCTANSSEKVENHLNLLSVYPNPFSSESRIIIFLPNTENISLSVTDLSGRQLATYSGILPGGEHTFKLQVASEGAYIVTSKTKSLNESLQFVCNNSASGQNTLEHVQQSVIQTNKSIKSSEEEFCIEKNDSVVFIGFINKCSDTVGIKSLKDYEKITFDFSKAASTISPPVLTENKCYYAKVQTQIQSTGCWDILSKGICWNTETNPTLENDFTNDGAGSSQFESNLEKLKPATTYYAKAYNKYANGVNYSSEISFTTPERVEVKINEVLNISNRSTTIDYKITQNTPVTISSHGVCYNTEGSPDLNDNPFLSSKKASINQNVEIFPLYPEKEYHVKAFAVAGDTTYYSDEIVVKTLATKNTLNDMGMIVGAQYDPVKKRIYLIGDGNHLECSPSIQQIAVAFNWAFADSVYHNYLSIDPIQDNPEGDWMKIRINPEAARTDFGWIMFEADRVMKNYSLGCDNVNKYPINSTIEGYKDLFDLNFENNEVNNNEIWNRFWLYPKSNSSDTSGTSIFINDATMGVKTETMLMVDGVLVPAEGVVDQEAEAFAGFFTENYQAFANENKIFRMLEQNLRLLLISEWIRQQKIPVNPDWIEYYGKKQFYMPDYTPTVRITEDKTLGLNQQTITLFGGVNFDFLARFVKHSSSSIEKEDQLKRGLTDYSEDLSYTEIGGLNRFVGALPTAGKSFVTKESLHPLDFSQTKPFILEKKDLNYLSRENNDWKPDFPGLFSSHYRGDVWTIPGISDFFADDFTFNGRIYGDYYFRNDGSGDRLIIKSKEDDNSEIVKNGDFLEVYEPGIVSVFRHFPYRNYLTNQIYEDGGQSTLNFSYNNGMLSRVSSLDKTVELIYGNNSSRLIGWKINGGQPEYVDPDSKPSGNISDFEIKLLGLNEKLTAQLDLNTGDYSRIVNPGNVSENSIRFLADKKREIKEALDKSRTMMIDYGGSTLFLSRNELGNKEIFQYPRKMTALSYGDVNRLKGADIKDIASGINGRIYVLQRDNNTQSLTRITEHGKPETMTGSEFMVAYNKMVQKLLSEKSNESTQYIAITKNVVQIEDKTIEYTPEFFTENNSTDLLKLIDEIDPTRDITIVRALGENELRNNISAELQNLLVNKTGYRYNIISQNNFETGVSKFQKYKNFIFEGTQQINFLFSNGQYNDHGINNDLKPGLKNIGIEMYEKGITIDDSKVEIVSFIGHNNSDFSNFIIQNGSYKNKILFILACNEGESNPELNLNQLSELVHKYGAKAVISINAQVVTEMAIRRIIENMISLIQNNQTFTSFQALLDSALNQAILSETDLNLKAILSKISWNVIT